MSFQQITPEQWNLGYKLWYTRERELKTGVQE